MIIQIIRNWFSDKQLAKSEENVEPELFFKSIKKQVESLIAIPANELGNNIPQIELCIASMEKAGKKVSRNKRSGLGMYGGMELSGYADTLAEKLKENNLLKYRVELVDISTRATLSNFGHYHHIVGPAMIACGKAHEEIDDFEVSEKCYTAIIKDFMIILERVEDIGGGLPQDDEYMIAVNALRIACERLIALNKIPSDTDEPASILERIRQIE